MTFIELTKIIIFIILIISFSTQQLVKLQFEDLNKNKNMNERISFLFILKFEDFA